MAAASRGARRALLVLFTMLCLPRAGQAQAGFFPRRVVDTDAVGGPGSGYLLLRLFGLPLEGECVPERRVVCRHHYYSSVSANDSPNEAALFDMVEIVARVSAEEFQMEPRR